MDKQFDIIHATRNNFLNLVNSLTVEDLNKIPIGFNNNIAWNFGHIIISQQILCYVRAGVVPKIGQVFIEKYQKGTKPESITGNDEINMLKKYLFALIEELKQDMQTDIFKNYQTVITQYGVKLTGINDAVQYFATHDALHLGFAKAIAKAL